MNILKISRIHRTFPILLIILIPFAIKNTPLKEYFIFGFSLVLLYSGISILNAKKDNDFKLEKNYKKITTILILISLIFALENKWILIYVAISLLLGFLYNEYSRKIILGDALIAGATHFSLPFFFAGKICEIDPPILIPSTIIIYFLGPAIAPITNIKDIKKDLKKGYKTLINTIKNKNLTIFISLICIEIIMILFYILIKKINIVFLVIILFYPLIKIKKFLKHKKYEKGLTLLRTYLLFSYYFIIIFSTNNLEIIILASTINLIHLLLTIMKCGRTK